MPIPCRSTIRVLTVKSEHCLNSKGELSVDSSPFLLKPNNDRISICQPLKIQGSPQDSLSRPLRTVSGFETLWSKKPILKSTWTMSIDQRFDSIRIWDPGNFDFNFVLPGAGNSNRSDTKYPLQESLFQLHVANVAMPNLGD